MHSPIRFASLSCVFALCLYGCLHVRRVSWLCARSTYCVCDVSEQTEELFYSDRKVQWKQSSVYRLCTCVAIARRYVVSILFSILFAQSVCVASIACELFQAIEVRVACAPLLAVLPDVFSFSSLVYLSPFAHSSFEKSPMFPHLIPAIVSLSEKYA